MVVWLLTCCVLALCLLFVRSMTLLFDFDGKLGLVSWAVCWPLVDMLI